MIERCDRFDAQVFIETLSSYPLFAEMGFEPKLDQERRSFVLRVPFNPRWRNNNNTLFGGVMLMASDPFPALYIGCYFPGSSAWTVRHGIEYLKPVRSATELRFELEETLLQKIESELGKKGSSRGTFEYFFYDTRDRRVAKVVSEYFLRIPPENRR